MLAPNSKILISCVFFMEVWTGLDGGGKNF